MSPLGQVAYRIADKAIRQIACGGYHTVILQEGQLGLGHNNKQNYPTLLMQETPIRQIA